MYVCVWIYGGKARYVTFSNIHDITRNASGRKAETVCISPHLHLGEEMVAEILRPSQDCFSEAYTAPTHSVPSGSIRRLEEAFQGIWRISTAKAGPYYGNMYFHHNHGEFYLI